MWRTAQEGIVRMQGDVANVVKLETIKAHGRQPALRLHESVQSVEFLDDKAMAAVVVTHTLPSGKVLVQEEARFYKQTPTGWQHTEPLDRCPLESCLQRSPRPVPAKVVACWTQCAEVCCPQ